MKSHLPLPEANLLTSVLLWEGPPVHNFMKKVAMGPWGHPESEQSRRKQVQSVSRKQSVSKIHLESVSLSVQLVPSTIPEPWGLYAVCNFHLMFKVLLTCYTKSATKSGPLSDPVLVGKNPNLGTISLSRHQATLDALSVRVGKAPTHPEDVHTMTSK